MILDVYIQYDRDSTLSSAGASIPTFDGTETRGLCAPIEFGNLVKNVINSRDVVLEWSTGTTTSLDLRMVRTALDEGGHQDVLLPLHENNIALVHLFRQNLGRSIPFHLPALFCVTHPGHSLMGAFHSSDVDVQATRLSVLFFLELLQHPSERSMDNIAVSTLIEISRGQRMARYQTPTSQIERQKYERLLERGRSKQAL